MDDYERQAKAFFDEKQRREAEKQRLDHISRSNKTKRRLLYIVILLALAGIISAVTSH